MTRSRRSRNGFVAVLAAVLAASCSSGESILDTGQGESTTPPTVPGATTVPGQSTVAPTTTKAPLAELPPCPVDALAEVTSPVEITFWHAMNTDLETTLTELTDAYNASQDKVRVRLVNQVGYEQAIDKFRNSAQQSRPNLVQLPEYAFKLAADSGTVVPIAACVEAEGYPLDDFLPKAIDASTTAGVLWTMPFNMSNPVLYYNRSLFVDAGLDPDDPPETLEQLRAVSEQLVSSGAAKYALVVDSGADSGGGWYLEQWLAKADEYYANNGNGRLAPATEVLYDGPVGVGLMTFLQDMVADGLAFDVGENPQGQDDLFKLADPNEPAAMTIHTSAALGPVVNLLEAGGLPVQADDLGIGPMPGPDVNPGVLFGGATLWIVAEKGDPATAATWDYIKYLVAPEQQSIWAAATGYVPVRQSSVELDPIKTTYIEDPRFKVAYDQLLYDTTGPAANGPVIGPLREVRVVTANAVDAILGGADPAVSLAAAAQQAESLMRDYNVAVGG